VGESIRLALKTCSPACPLLLDLHMCKPIDKKSGVVLLPCGDVEHQQPGTIQIFKPFV